MAFTFLVNNTNCPAPSRFDWGLMDINASDEGRTLDGKNHINRVAQKEKISLEWSSKDGAVVSTILQLFNSKYFNLTYISPLTNARVTKEFTRSDPDAPLYHFGTKSIYQSISFDVEER